MISGAWADHIAVQSMADMLRVNINIISTLNANIPLIEPADPGQNATMLRPTCNLGLIGQTHYVSLEKIEKPS